MKLRLARIIGGLAVGWCLGVAVLNTSAHPIRDWTIGLIGLALGFYGLGIHLLWTKPKPENKPT